jgi:hypothetical protein
MERTQSGTGETVKIGAEYADPFAAQKQLSVSRVALESTSGNPRAQGYEAFRGSQFGPAKPQPAGRLADRNMHLWRYELPKDLPIGTHTIQISNTDRQGKTHYESFVVEIVEELPPPQWRHEVWK